MIVIILDGGERETRHHVTVLAWNWGQGMGRGGRRSTKACLLLQRSSLKDGGSGGTCHLKWGVGHMHRLLSEVAAREHWAGLCVSSRIPRGQASIVPEY